MKSKWTPANIANLMQDDLKVTEGVILDRITVILYVGQHSAGEGLAIKEAEARVDHFSAHIEWRNLAIK